VEKKWKEKRIQHVFKREGRRRGKEGGREGGREGRTGKTYLVWVQVSGLGLGKRAAVFVSVYVKEQIERERVRKR